MNKKVLWIINQYGGSPYHGMVYRSYYMAREMVQKGYKVYLFAGSYSHLFTSLPETRGLFTIENIDGIKYCWVKLPPYSQSKSLGRVFGMFRFLFRLKRFDTSRFEKPDVILVSSLSPLPVRRAIKWAKKLKSKLVFEVRDIWPQTLIELNNMSKLHPLVVYLQKIENLAYRKADWVVSLLPGAKEHMLAHGMDEIKFRYIPNGIDIKAVENTKPLKEGYFKNLPDDKFIIGYAGTIGKANAMEFFAEAAEQLQDNHEIHFAIVGDGWKKKEVQNIVKSKELTNVSFHDPVMKEQVQSVLSHFDACYIGWNKQSLYRFGISANKIFEYMLSGKPVVHSVNAFNDPIKEAGCGFSVEAEDSRQIADVILKLYNMKQNDRDNLGSKGIKYVTEKHSYENLSEGYEEFFK